MGELSCGLGWFLGKEPELSRAVAMANALWSKKGRVPVRSQDALLIFQFPDRGMMEWALEAGPWFVDKRNLVLRRWSLDFSSDQMN